VTVTFDVAVRCDWCRLAIASSSPAPTRATVPPHLLMPHIAVLLERAADSGNGSGLPIPSPPGRQHHLHDHCLLVGPPKRVPVRKGRKPKPNPTLTPSARPSLFGAPA
jgi:hypothetical protein